MNRTMRVKYIVLIGFMGAGKTTVGTQLAKHLGVKFSDLDVLFRKHTSCTPGEYFAEKGEKAFRRIEARLLKDHLKRVAKRPGRGGVLATGGGVVVTSENRSLLKRLTKLGLIEVVWLNPKWTVIWSRLKKERKSRRTKAHRPLLWDSAQKNWRGEKEVRAIWSNRRRWYRECASFK